MRNWLQKAVFIRNCARWQICNYSEPSRFAKSVSHAGMNEHFLVNLFGEKPHRDEAQRNRDGSE